MAWYCSTWVKIHLWEQKEFRQWQKSRRFSFLNFRNSLIEINPFFTASFTYHHTSENTFLQLSSWTKKEWLNPSCLRNENQNVIAIGMGSSFRKADSALLVSWILQLILRVGTSTLYVTSASIPGVHRIFHVLSHEAHFVFMVLTE